MDADARGFRVALVQGELVNPPGDGLDALAVLEEAGWGAIQLPASDYPDDVAGPLLEQAAEQAEEFTRNGYRLALVGHRSGLDAALAGYGLRAPPAIEPTSARELRDFLDRVAT
ncbi:MAG TPA: hypothetical protein VFQ71_00395 [Gaiellales bacterium]|jgi:hypothetical protein|nr:hypothetical protein [Gaiellales bacterium]